MKKYFLLMTAATIVVSASAQNVGIGTSNPLNKLHVAGGLRLDTLAGVGGSGLLNHDPNGTVYSIKLTGDTNDVLRGDGSFGVAAAGGAAGWSLNGNTGVDPATQFLGTTDLFPLKFRVGNVPAGQMNAQDDNTGFGKFSLGEITTGDQNSFFGSAAGRANTVGNLNTFLGSWSGRANTAGGLNTCVGALTCYFSTTGSYNVAVGYRAMHLTTSSENVGIGSEALENNTIGIQNTAVGLNALINTTESWGNTALGWHAGSSYNNGYYNTFLGSETDASTADIFNSTAIGRGAIVTAPSQVRIGNSFVNSIGGYANWSNISDGRFKKNLKEDVAGLAFIMKLHPVTYNLDVTSLNEKLNRGRTKTTIQNDVRLISQREQFKYSGFVAQDVEKAAKEIGYDFSGVDAPKNESDVYSLRYSDFVVPLVKAVQEQQAMIEQQQKQIDALTKEINDLRKK